MGRAPGPIAPSIRPDAAARSDAINRPRGMTGTAADLWMPVRRSHDETFSWRIAVGLAAFVFFVVPWMAVAIWLSLRPSGARLGAPAAPWRPLTDYPPPTRDQQDSAETQSLDSGAAHDGKHAPIQAV